VAVSPDGLNVYVAAFLADAVVVFQRDRSTGALEQLPGDDGCVDQTGGVCTGGVALDGPRAVTVSPEGRNVYVASLTSDAVAIFDRDLGTGRLQQKAGLSGCIAEPNGVSCTNGVALDGPSAVVVSPDGRSVYVGTGNSDGIAVFDRDRSTGALVQKAGTAACVTETGTGGMCADGVALQNVLDLAMSPDGRHLYAASFDSGAIAVFDRTLSVGALTQKAGTAGCVSATGTGGACAVGVGVDDPTALVVSPDGRAVHAGMFGADAGVTTFDRDPGDGTLSQHDIAAACWQDFGATGCRDGVALVAPLGIAISGDGRNVYAATSQSSAVAAFTAVALAYDIDGDSEVEALTDGLLLVRFAFGLTGPVLVNGAVDLAGCTRCTAPVIEGYIEALHGP
jgi:6-phosphogluconolactonase (cycloisomerase 2 family)